MKIKPISTKLLRVMLFTLFVIVTNGLYSQSTINGSVKTTNGDPIEFATIQLLVDSLYQKSTLSDSLGYFSIETTTKGNCELLIDFIGYYSVKKNINLINDTTINIYLQPNPIWITEVTISAQKPLIQSKSDRFIVNICSNVDTKGKETTDILKQLPTIKLSEQSLNISGKSSVIIYINDHKVRMEGQALISYLNSLPTDLINTIEIISNPPAQYDAEGNVGIIKINTTKNIQPGWKSYFQSGSIKNSYMSYLVSAFASYTGEKIFFESSINNGNYSYLNQNLYNSYFPGATITTFNPKKWNYYDSDIQTTLGYNFNKNSIFIIDFQVPLFKKEIISDIENQTSFINPINNFVDSIIHTNGNTLKNSYTYNIEGFYKHSFSNNKSYFTANLAYLNNYTINKRSFSSTTQIGSLNSIIEDFYTEGKYDYNIFTSNVDLFLPLFSCNVNTGLKLSFIRTSSISKFFTVIDDYSIMDSTLFNKYNYNENTPSVYFSIEKSLQSWSFKVGIRSEITQTIINSIDTNEPTENNYVKLFPTVYISHKLKNNNNISISYSSRIERPPYQYLDPFKWYISKYDYAIGNPFLQPSDIKNVELTYLHNTTLSSKLYYSAQNNKIGQYVVLDSLNILNQIQKTDNFLNINNYGYNIYKYFELFQWMETVLQLDFYYSKFQSNKEEFTDIDGFGSSITLYNSIHINKKLQCVLNLEERTPGLYNYRNTNNYFKLDIGFNYLFTKNNIEVRFYVNDILKTANPEYHYTSGGVKQVYQNYFDTRMVRLVVSWKLGNWYNKTSETTTPSNIDEKRRI